jgi:hypothetical protein
MDVITRIKLAVWSTVIVGAVFVMLGMLMV